MNEIALLRHAMELRGWAGDFTGTFTARQVGVAEIATEVGSQGLNVTM